MGMGMGIGMGIGIPPAFTALLAAGAGGAAAAVVPSLPTISVFPLNRSWKDMRGTRVLDEKTGCGRTLVFQEALCARTQKLLLTRVGPSGL